MNKLVLLNLAVIAFATQAFVSTTSAQPFIVAGWDNWDSNTAPTPTVTATDVTASATASATRLLGDEPGSNNWTILDGQGDPGRGSSNDMTWGTFDGNGIAASTVTDMGIANMTATNAKVDAEVTFTITNNGTNDLTLDAFHMDVVAFRFKAPRIYSLDVLAGSDITVGTIFASEGNPMNNNSTNDIKHLSTIGLVPEHDFHEDLDIDMSGLADHTLASGESATIQLFFSGGHGDNSGGHHLFLDNVAFSSGFEFNTGDYDNDDDVDGDDLVEWQRTDGMSDGLTAWEENYGTTPLAAATASVPEPTSLLLLSLAASSVTACGRRRG